MSSCRKHFHFLISFSFRDILCYPNDRNLLTYFLTSELCKSVKRGQRRTKEIILMEVYVWSLIHFQVYIIRDHPASKKKKVKCCLLAPVSSENTGDVTPWEISEFIEWIWIVRYKRIRNEKSIVNNHKGNWTIWKIDQNVNFLLGNQMTEHLTWSQLKSSWSCNV